MLFLILYVAYFKIKILFYGYVKWFLIQIYKPRHIQT